MRRGFYLLLMAMGEFVAFGGSFMLAVLIIPANLRQELGVFVFFIGAVAAFLAVYVVRTLLRKWLWTACPHCGGRSYLRGLQPYYWSCTQCNRVDDTLMHGNW